jgi:hypothetical protein
MTFFDMPKFDRSKFFVRHSTYCCEQFFSRMNFVKSKIRARLTHLHLGNTLSVATSHFSPNLDRLVKDMHSQISH